MKKTIDANIKLIDTLKAFEIIENPLDYKGNKYIFREEIEDGEKVWVGIDNMDGCCWMAQHEKKRPIILWLNDIIDNDKLTELGGY